MRYKKPVYYPKLYLCLLLIGLTLLTACTSTTVEPPISPTIRASTTPSPRPPAATAVMSSPTSTSTSIPPTLTPTPTGTPPALGSFQGKGLGVGITPQTYISGVCNYLFNRWREQSSPPGTIVVPVMFHSIAAPGRPISDDTTISEDYFLRFMEQARQLGFTTINTAQMADFLNKNSVIPTRSMYLVVDDRKRGEFFEKYFAPYQKKYGWTVTNAWISHPDTPAYLWKENEAFVDGGLVDFQAHGVIHNTPIEPDSPDSYVRNEITGPLAAIEQHFGKKPIAFIWPRGLFTAKAVQIARQAGYQIGLTTLPRGPVMYNWIPLGKEEISAGDPLMVLPRYWSTTAISALESAIAFSEQASGFARENKEREISYYKSYCQSFPALPTPEIEK